VIGFFASSPYFRRDGETAPNFAKSLTVPSFADLSLPNGATYENGKIFLQKRDNRSTFCRKKRKLPFTYFEESVADSLYKFHSRASLSLYYRSPDGVAIPSGLGAEAENDAIAAI